MDSSYQTPISKSILTAVFAGIAATLCCLGFDLFYINKTGFPLSSIINVSSLIFSVNFVFLIIGFIYYGFVKTMKRGPLMFMIVFILLTIFLGWRATLAHRSDDPILNREFHQLLLAMIIIMGLTAALGIPLLYHSKKFEEHVL
jgi:hypothetical protein